MVKDEARDDAVERPPPSVAFIVATAATTLAQVGPVTIKGKLYISGELTKVKCLGDDGNTLDGSTSGQREFTIDSTCALFPDAGTADEFLFVGQEEVIIVNGVPKSILIFSGTEQGTGPVSGAAHSEEKFSGAVFTTEKGRMTYSYFDGSDSIIFVGSFKAKF